MMPHPFVSKPQHVCFSGSHTVWNDAVVATGAAVASQHRATSSTDKGTKLVAKGDSSEEEPLREPLLPEEEKVDDDAAAAPGP